MKTLGPKPKILPIIFVRAICCMGIVIFHYFCHSKGNFKLFYVTANSSFGFIFVTSFFCISGVVLYHNYPKIKSIKSFYFKRWKNIFPSFYICYIYFFFRISLSSHKLVFKGQWYKFLISLIGLDGYLSYKIKTFYLVGDWFLGAIIIIYALYPLLLKMILKTNFIINNIFICFFYCIMYKTHYFIISRKYNIITCITSFYFGIETIRFRKFYLENKIILIFCFFIWIFLYKIKIQTFIIIWQIQGFSLFIILFHIGKYIMSTKIDKIFMEINNISFGIFLFHHRFVFEILALNNPTEWYLHLLLVFMTFLLTIICSKVHLIVVNSIIKSSTFKKLEALFL